MINKEKVKSLIEKIEDTIQMIEQTKQLSENQKPQKSNKEIIERLMEIVEEQKQYLPTNIKKGQLKQVLGYQDSTNLQEVQRDEILKRQKQQINQGKIDYQTMIRRLNWQRVMNKTNNPQFSQNLKWVMDELKKWWESKKKKQE